MARKIQPIERVYQKCGHTQESYFNCSDNSRCQWVINQRHCCIKEKRRKLLESIGFVFSESNAQEDKWLDSCNQLKKLHQKSCYAQVKYFNGSGESLF